MIDYSVPWRRRSITNVYDQLLKMEGMSVYLKAQFLVSLIPGKTWEFRNDGSHRF